MCLLLHVSGCQQKVWVSHFRGGLIGTTACGRSATDIGPGTTRSALFKNLLLSNNNNAVPAIIRQQATTSNAVTHVLWVDGVDAVAAAANSGPVVAHCAEDFDGVQRIIVRFRIIVVVGRDSVTTKDDELLPHDNHAAVEALARLLAGGRDQMLDLDYGGACIGTRGAGFVHVDIVVAQRRGHPPVAVGFRWIILVPNPGVAV